jgi:transposase
MRQNKDTRPIVYLDETWVNQNHSQSIARQHDSMVGPKIPTGKGGRLIVVHAGCAKYGFIQNSKLVFRSNTGNSTDYHSQMNSEVFKSWFTQMLNSLEEPSVIVMDNASYHSTLIDNFPKINTRKADVQAWLTKKNVDFSPLENLAELRQKVKALIPFEKKYELDVLALEMGHEVIRLPPYHCQYNPIELIWAQVKNQVATKNKTSKMVDIEKLTHEALDSVTQHDWEKCVRHAEALQDQDNEKEIMRDSVLEPIILTLLPDDSDWDSSDDEGNSE